MMRRVVGLILLLTIFIIPISGTTFRVHGVYTAWGQSQHDFFFGKGNYNDNYVVQMLRFKIVGMTSDKLKFVTRLDIAQGWWGVDNALKSAQRTGTKGGSALFDFKDTNFLVHVDQAYISFNFPNLPITARVGRMWYGLGNRIMVDNNYDGVQIDIKKVFGKKLTLSWAKVSEGVDALSDNDSVSADQRGNWDARDAHLFILNLNNTFSPLKADIYGFYYRDWSIGDKNAYVPDHLQFFKTRFSPQVTQLTAVGFAGIYNAGKLTVKGEFDYLWGKDEIENSTHGAKQMWDINNGYLSGYNIYLNMNYAVSDKLSLGLIGGMGSGDDDLTGGKGNVNKLRTSGFFYITEVWEDSIMPDEEGITPQGLGAPNVRGYRELENTTILQVNGTFKPHKKVSLYLSYSFLRATQPIHAWNSDGNDDWIIDPDVSSQDLGQEVDFKISYKMYKELNLTLRGGYFMPKDAAGYLINGTNEYSDPAWELKFTVTYKF
jgi:hypothetical protein